MEAIWAKIEPTIDGYSQAIQWALDLMEDDQLEDYLSCFEDEPVTEEDLDDILRRMGTVLHEENERDRVEREGVD